LNSPCSFLLKVVITLAFRWRTIIIILELVTGGCLWLNNKCPAGQDYFWKEAEDMFSEYEVVSV
jgi:hypothetical protein